MTTSGPAVHLEEAAVVRRSTTVLIGAAFEVALRLLIHDPIRFVATIFGLSIATILILLQLGFMGMLLHRASSIIEQLHADIWVVSHDVQAIDFPVDFSDNLVWVVRSTPGVQRADNLTFEYLNEIRPTGERETTIVLAMKDFRRWRFPRFIDGNVDDLRGGRFCLVDGSPSNIIRFGRISRGDFTVLNGSRAMVVAMSRGLFSFTTSPIVLMSENTLRQMAHNDRLTGVTSFILVKVAPGANPLAVRQRLRQRLPHQDVLLEREWIDRTRMYWLLRTGLGLNMGLNIGLGILVGLAVVSLNLYVVTMEHFREFGTIKAIGGRDSDIRWIIAIQGLIYGLASFALGWAVCRVLRVGLARIGIAPRLSPLTVGAALFFSVGLCLCASLLSFSRIARIDPIEVMRN